MWTVVYIAPNKREADRIQKMLSKEGLLARLRAIGTPAQLNENCSMEILVPESEVHEALEVINSL